MMDLPRKHWFSTRFITSHTYYNVRWTGCRFKEKRYRTEFIAWSRDLVRCTMPNLKHVPSLQYLAAMAVDREKEWTKQTEELVADIEQTTQNEFLAAMVAAFHCAMQARDHCRNAWDIFYLSEGCLPGTRYTACHMWNTAKHFDCDFGIEVRFDHVIDPVIGSSVFVTEDWKPEEDDLDNVLIPLQINRD